MILAGKQAKPPGEEKRRGQKNDQLAHGTINSLPSATWIAFTRPFL
jgi:hypothetical protein